MPHGKLFFCAVKIDIVYWKELYGVKLDLGSAFESGGKPGPTRANGSGKWAALRPDDAVHFNGGIASRWSDGGLIYGYDLAGFLSKSLVHFVHALVTIWEPHNSWFERILLSGLSAYAIG